VIAIDGDLCPLCGDPLPPDADDVHDECLDEWRAQIEARTCYVCGDPLDDDAPDNAIHDACESARWGPPPADPFLRPVEDVDLPADPS